MVFIECYLQVLKILKKNLVNLETNENYEIIEKNIYDSNVFLNLRTKFDLIFLDPPYKDKNVDVVLNKIDNSKILKYL